MKGDIDQGLWSLGSWKCEAVLLLGAQNLRVMEGWGSDASDESENA